MNSRSCSPHAFSTLPLCSYDSKINSIQDIWNPPINSFFPLCPLLLLKFWWIEAYLLLVYCLVRWVLEIAVLWSDGIVQFRAAGISPVQWYQTVTRAFIQNCRWDLWYSWSGEHRREHVQSQSFPSPSSQIGCGLFTLLLVSPFCLSSAVTFSLCILLLSLCFLGSFIAFWLPQPLSAPGSHCILLYPFVSASFFPFMMFRC